MFVAGATLARIAAANARDRRALPWAFPARNAPVAVLIATSVGGPAAMVSFIAVLFATQLALLVPIALWVGGGARRRDRVRAMGGEIHGTSSSQG